MEIFKKSLYLLMYTMRTYLLVRTCGCILINPMCELDIYINLLKVYSSTCTAPLLLIYWSSIYSPAWCAFTAFSI